MSEEMRCSLLEATLLRPALHLRAAATGEVAVLEVEAR